MLCINCEGFIVILKSLVSGNVSRPLSVVSCDNIFKHLGKMPDSYIIFCYTQELLEYYLLDNKQQTNINGLC